MRGFGGPLLAAVERGAHLQAYPKLLKDFLASKETPLFGFLSRFFASSRLRLDLSCQTGKQGPFLAPDPAGFLGRGRAAPGNAVGGPGGPLAGQHETLSPSTSGSSMPGRLARSECMGA